MPDFKLLNFVCLRQTPTFSCKSVKFPVHLHVYIHICCTANGQVSCLGKVWKE